MDMDLKAWIKQKPSSTRLNIFPLFFKQISVGLTNLHNGTIFHGDIKTENILVRNDNIFKISDLGLSGNKYLLENFNTKGGTISYRTPESLAGRDINSYYFNSMDLWAFGLCCIYFLTNYKLFTMYTDYYILEAIFTNSTVRNIISFNEFVNRCKNGIIEGYLDVDYIFDKAGLSHSKNTKYMRYIYDLCNLNPLKRKLPEEKVSNQLIININKFYNSYDDIVNNIFLVMSIFTFNITVPEKVMCVELLFRYLKINNLTPHNNYTKEIIVIIGIIKKYFWKIWKIDEEHKLLFGNVKKYDKLFINILESIDYKIYNPLINEPLTTMTQSSNFMININMYTFTKPNINEWFKESYEFEYDLFIKNSNKAERNMRLTLSPDKMMNVIYKFYEIFENHKYNSQYYNNYKMRNNRTIPFTIYIYSYIMAIPKIFKYMQDVVIVCCLIISTMINEKANMTFHEFFSLTKILDINYIMDVYKEICKIFVKEITFNVILPFDYTRTIHHYDYVNINRYLILLTLTSRVLINGIKPSFLESKTKKLSEHIFKNDYNITDDYIIKIINHIKFLNTYNIIIKNLFNEQYKIVINYVNNFKS